MPFKPSTFHFQLLCFLIFMGTHLQVQAQEYASDSVTNTNLTKISKVDGSTLVGFIVSQTAKEIVFDIKGGERVTIPQYRISNIEIVEKPVEDELAAETDTHPFNTRYFYSTNGLPLKKGEHHIRCSLTGPTIQFGLGYDFQVSITTTWIVAPLIVGLKKNFHLEGNVHFSTGIVAGHFLYLYDDAIITAPFIGLTIGDVKRNITINAAYANASYRNSKNNFSKLITTVGAMATVSKKITLVFDNIILHRAEAQGEISGFTQPGEILPTIFIVMPGLRYNHKTRNAYQFGLMGIFDSKDGFAFALPTFQYAYSF